MKAIRAAAVPLGAPKVGEHFIVGPTGSPLLSPPIVVLALATDINHAVQRRCASQNLAAIPPINLSGPSWIWLAVFRPFVFQVVDQRCRASRHGEEQPRVRAARLQQCDADGRLS